ncbi:hypothetical protein AB0M80_35355 [Amycolatopsis sp. NPDC051045]|uniref:hypothetical protein n=1 Tax=Amycolatopsis sp. NPDC051045 TaxID=3156922 RepID=UPI00343322FB
MSPETVQSPARMTPSRLLAVSAASPARLHTVVCLRLRSASTYERDEPILEQAARGRRIGRPAEQSVLATFTTDFKKLNQ